MPEPQYRENLPEGCPLPESGPIQEEMIMYRFVHNPPSEADFASHVMLHLAKSPVQKILAFSVEHYPYQYLVHIKKQKSGNQSSNFLSRK